MLGSNPSSTCSKVKMVGKNAKMLSLHRKNSRWEDVQGCFRACSIEVLEEMDTLKVPAARTVKFSPFCQTLKLYV